MLRKTKQLKNSVGVILAGIFVVFIIGVSVSSVHLSKPDKNEIISAGSPVLTWPVALRSNQNFYTQLDFDLSGYIVDGNLPEFIDLISGKISKLKPLPINTFTRNIFYTFIRINAP